MKRLSSTTTILDTEMEFVEPGILQLSYIVNFLTEAFGPLMIADFQASKLKRDDLINKVLVYAQEQSAKAQSEDEKVSAPALSILGIAMLSPATHTYLKPAIEQCFPGVKVEEVTTETILACFQKVMAGVIN